MKMDTIVQRALLESRQEKQCGSDSASEDYNMSLHIFAIFLIMTCGTTAAVFPTIVRAYPWLAISKHVLFISRHFGTGVLIALAFVHLLPTAFENLWDDCLSHFWTDGYDAMPGFIAMLAALAIMLVEMGFTCKGFRQAQTAGALEERVEGIQLGGTAPLNEHEVSPPEECKARGVTSLACANGDQCSADLICPCDTPEQGAPTARSAQISNDNIFSDKVTESSLESLPAEKKERRMILQCLLLEAGILFHSVFIGLSISLSTGTTFIALMIAISFHQIFEGLALGARIAAVPSFRVSNPKPWVMSVAYGLTCPLGQAIGLGLRKTYNPDGETALLVVGVANAISAGMIMYAGLVQLLGEELLSEKSYSKLTFRARVEAIIALILGCLLMAMIAIWA